MIDNGPIIALVKLLIDEMEALMDLKRYQKPVRFTLNSQVFETARAQMGGTQYKPYNSIHNETYYFIGRPVIIQNGNERRRGLSGIITGFDVCALKDSPARERYLDNNKYDYFSDCLFAQFVCANRIPAFEFNRIGLSLR